MKTAIITALVLLSFGTALADGKVLLVTDLNSPDSYAATVAGNYEGAPVLVLENGTLNENITTTLSEMKPTEVIIVGGPVVVRESVDNKLRELGYNVTRLWGLERTKTAIELAKYFWYNSSCAVLVEDTHSPIRDALLQAEGINEAIRNKCPLIPVPKDTVPVDLLTASDDLNITNIIYLTRSITNEMRDALSGFNVVWINGTIPQIRAKVINRALQKHKGLLLIATNNWKESLAIGAALNNDSLIKWVNSTDNLQGIISLIKDNNLSPIKIVGNPFIGGQVYNELKNNGINSVNYIGTKPASIARRLWNAEKEKFKAKYKIVKKLNQKRTTLIKKRIKTILNNTRRRFNELFIKAEELNTKSTEINKLINDVNESINEATRISENNPQEAKAIALRKFNLLRTRLFNKTKWTTELKDELSSKAQLIRNINITNVENNLKTYTKACGNADEIKNILTKAKELKIAAEKETNPKKQALLLKESKKLLNDAKRLGIICIKYKKISPKIRSVATRRLNSITSTSKRILRKIRKA